MKQSDIKFAILPILFGFFVMGFVDVVGISTNYVKHDFGLSDTLANLIPMMVFLWFAVFSIPAGMLMGRIGRRNTVAVSLGITIVAMLLPLFFYDFTSVLLAFALLGIGNTILQVSLNPMVASVVSPGKVTSVLTFGTVFESGFFLLRSTDCRSCSFFLGRLEIDICRLCCNNIVVSCLAAGRST